MLNFLSKIFPSKSDKDIKRIFPIVEEINRYSEQLQGLTDEELKGKTQEFKQRIAEGTVEIKQEIDSAKEQLKSEELSLDQREDLFTRIEEAQKNLYATIAETLTEMLPEAYAVVKDACRRLVGQSWEITGQKIVWDMVPFDVQLVGGVVLHEGKIAEMATGEGKTLVATLPLYLNALAGLRGPPRNGE